jgi:hypothetical protein
MEMKARKVLEGASYDPDTLKALCQAFDEAWAAISHMYSSDHSSEWAIEKARLGLANATLAVAPLYGKDVEALKDAALQHFALTYSGPGDPAEPISNYRSVP